MKIMSTRYWNDSIIISYLQKALNTNLEGRKLNFAATSSVMEKCA
jgi:hypothetical protein